MKVLFAASAASLLCTPMAVRAAADAAASSATAAAVDASADANGAATAAASSNASIEEGSSNAEAKIERVEVTGSHIKRIAVEGASPIQTVTKKELEKSGYNSVSDVLRDSGASSFGGMREESGSNAAGTAHVDLRGLGAANTLVLLNGQRLPTDAVTGAVDLNLIPMAAVERVEVLKDGASAIYGSDALGGVVNIITKKDFKGAEASINQMVPDAKGGARTDIGLVAGTSGERHNAVTVLQFRDNDVVYARDRFWTANSPSLIGGPGSYRGTSGLWVADANCPADKLVTNSQGTFCGYNPADYMTKLPDLQQISMMSEGSYELSSKVKLTARIGATQRDVKWSFAAAPGTFTIPAAVADHLGPGGGPLPGVTPGQDLSVRYRLTELGTRDTKVRTYGYNVLLGSNVQLGNDWQMDFSTAHNGVRSKDEGVNGYALTTALTDAIASGAYNPFAPEGQKGSLEHTRYSPVEKTTSLLTSVDAKTSGPLAELSGGPLSLAVGTSITHQKYTDEFDEKSVAGEVFGNAGSSGGGSRVTQALFTELSLPIVPAVELQLAGRFDHYSDFGNTTNPKAAILIRPHQSVLLRASAGSGFRAPLMQDMYAATSQGFPTFIDHKACAMEQAAGGDTSSCMPQQYGVTSSGNPGLKEEKSVSYNAGIIVEPTKRFSIGADVFLTKLNNVVGIDYGDATKAEAAGIDLASRGVIVNRDSNGYIVDIVAPMQNLSAQQVSGIDLSAAFQVTNEIKLTTVQSQLFAFREEGFPGMGLTNKLDQNGKPRWRNVTALTITPSDRHDLTLAAMTIAGQEKDVKEMGRLSNYATLDVAYSYKTKEMGTISLGIKNVLGTTPPLDNSNPSEMLNTDLYDQVGRQFLVGYRTTF